MKDPNRITNPFNPNERPTFLPGDKVRDKRDPSGEVFRIKKRIATYNIYEIIELESVNSRRLLVCGEDVVPHLEMVAEYVLFDNKLNPKP